MSVSRRIGEHRPTVILAVLVAMSVTSLVTGARGTFIHEAIRAAVSVTAYPFLKIMKGAEHGGDYVTELVLSYDSARTEAQIARRRLSEMMQHAAQRKELLAENQRLRRMLEFTRHEPRLTLEPVEVVIIEMFKGIVTVDRGSLQGIRESMCAVTEDGIVGIVTQVDPATSNIVTLHNADCKLGAMIQRNRVRGIVYGSGSDLSRYCTLNFIDMKDDVQESDLVVTSPESTFPAGYPIGRVVAVRAEAGSLWKYAEVEPAVDPYTLDEVFILLRAAASDEELAGPMLPDDAVSVAPALPDMRSLQERYAP